MSLLLFTAWLQLQMAQCKTHQSSACFCSWASKTFRHLFRVLAYSTQLRWWNIYLNSGVFCTIIMWEKNHIYRANVGFAVRSWCSESQLYQRFSNWWRGSFNWELLGQEIRQNAVLTEERFQENAAAISEHSPRKSLTRLAQQTQFSATTAWSATRKLRLLQYKITQLQVTKDGDYEKRTHFCNYFCGQYMAVSLNRNLHFYWWSFSAIWVGIRVFMLRPTGIGAALTRDRILKYPIEWLMCNVPLLPQE
jgi:hypothetical protein